MPAPKKNPLTNLIKKGAKKAVVKVKPKPNLKANPKSNVKVKPAAKTKPNPYNDYKAEVYATDSQVRGFENNSRNKINLTRANALPAGKAKNARAYRAANKKKK